MLIVPEVVIGPPVSPVPVATLVTVPEPASVDQEGFAPGPPETRIAPAEDGPSGTQFVALRYKIEPWVLVNALSNNAVTDVAAIGFPVPVMFASTVLALVVPKPSMF